MNLDTLVYMDRIRAIVQQLPASEGICYGTPGLYVKKKLLANPAVFYFTDHYSNYPMMLIRLQKVSQKDLEHLIHTSFKMRVPKTVLKEYEAASKSKRRS